MGRLQNSLTVVEDCAGLSFVSYVFYPYDGGFESLSEKRSYEREFDGYKGF
jgi:hypothetical protein